MHNKRLQFFFKVLFLRPFFGGIPANLSSGVSQTLTSSSFLSNHARILLSLWILTVFTRVFDCMHWRLYNTTIGVHTGGRSSLCWIPHTTHSNKGDVSGKEKILKESLLFFCLIFFTFSMNTNFLQEWKKKKEVFSVKLCGSLFCQISPVDLDHKVFKLKSVMKMRWTRDRWSARSVSI